MTALSHELKSLQEELSVSKGERAALPADDASASGAAASVGQPEDTADEQQRRRDLREFASAITEFVQQAETNVSMRTTATVMGAMIVGILIGRLLGRRR